MSADFFAWGGLVAAFLAAAYAARGVIGTRRSTIAMLVVTANIAAVLCAAWLAMTAVRPAESGLAWLLTAGSERVARLRPVFHAVDVYPEREVSDSVPLTDPAQLWLDPARQRQVAVVGWGLSREHLRGADAAAIERFDAAPQPRGIARLDWPARAREGSPLRVSGAVAGVDRARIRVALGDLELGIAATGPEGEFELDLLAPLAGRYALDLQVIDEDDRLLDSGPLPLQVIAVPRLNVLALASSPSFGWRYLQNWLSDNGAGLLLRTRVSREHFLQQRHNIDAGLSVGGLDDACSARSILSSLIVTHGPGLRSPRVSESRRQVRDKSLGLLLLVDHASGAAAATFPTRAPQLSEAPPRADTRLQSADSAPLPLIDVPALAITGASSVWRDGDGLPVAAFNGSGAGRIGLALRLPVYRWVLQGEADAYARYWQQLLAAIARPQPARLTSQLSSRLPVVGMRVELCFDAAVNPVVELIGSDAFAEALTTYRRPWGSCAVAWPRVAGWHGLRNADETDFFFVFEAADWKGLQAAERIAATRGSLGGRAGSHVSPAWNPPPELGFLVLLVLLGLLWWEQKRRPARLVKPEADGA